MTDEAVGGVVKVIELVGSSPQSFSDAVRNAVNTASKSLRNLRGVEVLNTTAEIEGNELTNYKAQCKIAFVVDEAALGQSSDIQAEAGAMAAPQPPQ